MDIIGFLNDLTGNNLLFWKVVAATIVFALAGVQVFLAARLWRASTVPRISEASASTAHRWIGRVTLFLGIAVAILGVLKGDGGADDDGAAEAGADAGARAPATRRAAPGGTRPDARTRVIASTVPSTARPPASASFEAFAATDLVRAARAELWVADSEM